MNKTRVILVDDHNLVRAGIRSLLKNFAWIDIVEEADCGREALRLIILHKPDLVLLDIALPDMTGLDAAVQIKAAAPDVKIIFLSMYVNEEYVMRALQVGAMGYLLKGASTAELELALRAVIQGEAYLSPSISRQVIDGYVQRVHTDNRATKPPRSETKELTARQTEVLCLIADGLTTKEIAQKLELSVKTVDAHRAQLMKELDIHDIAGLVRYAIKSGLVE